MRADANAARQTLRQRFTQEFRFVAKQLHAEAHRNVDVLVIVQVPYLGARTTLADDWVQHFLDRKTETGGAATVCHHGAETLRIFARSRSAFDVSSGQRVKVLALRIAESGWRHRRGGLRAGQYDRGRRRSRHCSRCNDGSRWRGSDRDSTRHSRRSRRLSPRQISAHRIDGGQVFEEGTYRNLDAECRLDATYRLNQDQRIGAQLQERRTRIDLCGIDGQQVGNQAHDTCADGGCLQCWGRRSCSRPNGRRHRYRCLGTGRRCRQIESANAQRVFVACKRIARQVVAASRLVARRLPIDAGAADMQRADDAHERDAVIRVRCQYRHRTDCRGAVL